MTKFIYKKPKKFTKAEVKDFYAKREELGELISKFRASLDAYDDLYGEGSNENFEYWIKYRMNPLEAYTRSFDQVLKKKKERFELETYRLGDFERQWKETVKPKVAE